MELIRLERKFNRIRDKTAFIACDRNGDIDELVNKGLHRKKKTVFLTCQSQQSRPG